MRRSYWKRVFLTAAIFLVIAQSLSYFSALNTTKTYAQEFTQDETFINIASDDEQVFTQIPDQTTPVQSYAPTPDNSVITIFKDKPTITIFANAISIDNLSPPLENTKYAQDFASSDSPIFYPLQRFTNFSQQTKITLLNSLPEGGENNE